MFCTLFALWLTHWASLPWSVWEAAEVSGMPTLEWDEGPTLPTLLMKKLLTITNTETIYLDIYISYYLTDWPGGMRIISPATNGIIFISCGNLLKAALTFARICYFHVNTRVCTVSYKTGGSGVQPIHSPQSFFVWFLHFSDYEADYPFSGHHSFLRHFRPKVGTSYVKYVTFQIKSGFPFSLMTD